MSENNAKTFSALVADAPARCVFPVPVNAKRSQAELVIEANPLGLKSIE